MLGEERIKVLNIIFVGEMGYERTLELPLNKRIEIKIIEPRMRNDSRETLQSLVGVFFEQRFKQVFQLYSHIVIVLRMMILNEREERLLVLMLKGRTMCDHFVDDATESPEINGFSMALFLDDLRGHILGGAADRIGLARLVDLQFAQAEIRQFYVPLFIDYHILGLQVSANK